MDKALGSMGVSQMNKDKLLKFELPKIDKTRLECYLNVRALA